METLTQERKMNESYSFEDRNLGPKNFQINGFRAILSILIVLYHFCVRYFEVFQGTTMSPWIPSASIVVDSFFVLSGFFLSFKNPKYFLKHKIIGLVIPFLICTCGVFALRLISGYSNGISWLDFGLNLLIVPLFVGIGTPIDGASWYIIDLLFILLYYFAMNMIAHLFKRRLVPFFMMLLGILSAVTLFLSSIQTGSFLIKGFRVLFKGPFVFVVFGYFARDFIVGINSKDRSFLRPVFFSLATILLILGLIFLGWYNAILFLVFLGLLGLCVMNKVPFFEWKPFQVVGDSSLFIYLLHQIPGFIIIDLMYKQDPSLYVWGLLLAIAFALLSGIGLSFLYKKLMVPLFKTDNVLAPTYRKDQEG